MNASVDIGQFVVGEKPIALEYTFQDASGTDLDITGYVAKFSWREKSGVATTQNATLSGTGDDGRVTYVWSGSEFMSPGHYIGELWVGNNTHRFASVLITWTVRTAVGAVPAI